METYEEVAQRLAKKVCDEGPSYPSTTVIWRFLREAQREGLVTVHFTPPVEVPTIADRTPNTAATGVLTLGA